MTKRKLNTEEIEKAFEQMYPEIKQEQPERMFTSELPEPPGKEYKHASYDVSILIAISFLAAVAFLYLAATYKPVRTIEIAICLAIAGVSLAVFGYMSLVKVKAVWWNWFARIVLLVVVFAVFIKIGPQWSTVILAYGIYHRLKQPNVRGD